jgi:predicted nucleic acid-binding protein
MIAIDTTVLVYAVGSDHPYRDPCRTLVEAISQGDVRATTTVEVVQEFAHVRARRRGRDDAVQLASSFADLLAPLTHARDTHLRAGLELWRRHSGIGCFDAVLVAVARELGASTIVSADRAFGTVQGVEHTIPDEAGVAALLAT